MSNIALATGIDGLTSDYLIYQLKNSTSPFAVVQQIVISKASFGGTWPAFVNNVQFTNLQPITYIVQVWESANGTTTGTLRVQYNIDAALLNNAKLESYEIIIGAGRGAPYYDPNPGDTSYINTDIAGTDIEVNKVGYGFLSFEPLTGQITSRPTGGFDFVTPLQFETEERYTIKKLVKLGQPPVVTGGGGISGIETITTDTSYTSARNGKVLKARFTGQAGIITFPDLNTVAGNTVTIDSHGGSQINVELAFQPGQGVDFEGTTEQFFYMGKNEVLQLYFDGGKAHIINGYSGYAMVGKTIWGDVQGPNELTMNSILGSPINGNIYKRLYWWIVNRLPAPQRITIAQWEDANAFVTYNYGEVAPNPPYSPSTVNTAQSVFRNRKKFAVDVGTKNIYLPNIMGLHIAAGATPGEYKHHTVGPSKKRLYIDPTNNSSDTSGYGKIGTGSQGPEGSFNPLNTYWETINPNGNIFGGGTVAADNAYTEPVRVIKLPILII